MAEKLEILLRDCKRGKARSQEALYRRFASAMYGLCLQYASSEEDAQDILQEGFIKVFGKLDNMDCRRLRGYTCISVQGLILFLFSLLRLSYNMHLWL